MKKRLFALSALLIFGLVAVAFAYTRTNTTTEISASASCPMSKQTASTGEHKDSCCGMADCCKDGKCSMVGACCKDKDSCPMKQKGESKSTDETGAATTNAVNGGESCCKPGAECCKGGGACCKHKS